MKRAVPIKPSNSEVLGHGVTGYWLDWWYQSADWRGAFVTGGTTSSRTHGPAPLHVRCKRWWRWCPKQKRKLLWRDGTEWYRVRPKGGDCSTVRVERRNGVWYWVPQQAAPQPGRSRAGGVR